MKRTKRSLESRTGTSLQPIAEAQLTRVKGGATAIEYGLVYAAPTPPPTE